MEQLTQTKQEKTISEYNYIDQIQPTAVKKSDSSLDSKNYRHLFDILLRMNDTEAKQLDILLQNIRNVLVQKAQFYRLK